MSSAYESCDSAWQSHCQGLGLEARLLQKFIIVLVLIFLGEITVNSYILRSTPAMININTALQQNQSCSNLNVISCIGSEADEWMDLLRME